MKKFLLILSIITVLNIKANVIVEEQNVYFQRYGGGKKYLSEIYKHFSVNNVVSYCVEPGMPVTTNDYVEMAKLPYSDDIIERLKLIGYYGYDYKEHKSEKYRMATQALIWELLSGQTVEFYTKQYGYGDYIDITHEKESIINLVERHKIKPKINTYFEAFNNENLVIDDLNEVLNEYFIEYSGENIAEIKDNKLFITILKKDKLILKRKKYDNKISIFYEGRDKDSQLLATLSLDDIDKIEIDLNPLIGQVKLIKKSNKQSNYLLENAVYGIYDTNDNLIKKIKTNDDGIGITDINKGKFYLKEIESPIGYELDDSKYFFDIDENNLYKEIEIFEKVIESKIIINKKYEDKILNNEENIRFDIYQNNNFVSSITTSENGIAEIVLPYGVYLFKQVNTKKGYLKVDDFEVNVDGSKKEYFLELIDRKINAFVKIIKIDEESSEVIRQKGIKFKIKDLDRNEYICISDNCVFETNNDGYVITPEKLSGNLEIEECQEKINGYLWNADKIRIFIGDIIDNDVYVVKFKNKRVKGTIEVLKLGESVNPLENVSINLYAREDIIINNNLIFRKNELVDSRVTNKNGVIIFDDLELGKYYLKEIRTNDNYILDNKEYKIDINYIDENTKIVKEKMVLNNYLKRGKLVFNKIDSLTKDRIKGTVIQIYNDKQLIYEGMTDDNGQIILSDLIEGSYYIVEKEASVGYVRNDEKILFDIIYDKVTDVYMENDPYIDVPNTGKSINYLVFILFGLVLKKYEKII